MPPKKRISSDGARFKEENPGASRPWSSMECHSHHLDQHSGYFIALKFCSGLFSEAVGRVATETLV